MACGNFTIACVHISKSQQEGARTPGGQRARVKRVEVSTVYAYLEPEARLDAAHDANVTRA